MGAIFSLFGGIGNSVTNITNNINKNITNLVISSVQSSSTDISQSQTLDIDCTQWTDDQKEGKMACVEEAAQLIREGHSSEEATQICKIWEDGTCGANGVTMKGVMQSQINDDLKLKIKTYLANNIKSAIDNAANQSGAGGIGNSVTSQVGSEIDNIQGVIENYMQNDYNNISAYQSIKLKNGSISLITQDTFMDSFKSYTASNTVYTTSVNKIASTIKNATDQNLGSGNTIITIIVVIIGLLIIFGIIYWIWQKRSSKNTSTLASQPPTLSSSKSPNI